MDNRRSIFKNKLLVLLATGMVMTVAWAVGATYNVEIVLDGEKTDDIGPINLEQAEKWEQGVTFTPTRDGPDQKVEFLLYKDSRQLYQTLHLWIDVNGDVI